MKEVISAGDFLKDKIDSKEWWVIPIMDPDQVPFMSAFEHHFYVPEKTALFETLFVFNPIRGRVCFGFGHKSAAGPRAVATWLRKKTATPHVLRKDLEERDILVLCPKGWNEETVRIIGEASLVAIQLTVDGEEPVMSVACVDPPAGRA